MTKEQAQELWDMIPQAMMPVIMTALAQAHCEDATEYILDARQKREELQALFIKYTGHEVE